MSTYRICFACSFPEGLGCRHPDDDFYAEYEFEGNASETIKRAEKISREEYGRFFQWWIVEDPNINKSQLTLFTPLGELDKLKISSQVSYHSPVEDLITILNEPTYTETSLFPLGIKDSIEFGYRNWEFHCVDFDLYNNDLLVDRGKQKPGSSTKPHNVTKSLFSVEKMIYELNLAYGKQVSHVLRIDRHTDFHTREFVEQHPLKMDIYEFQVQDKLMSKYKIMSRYEKQHQDVFEKERRLRNICERLETRGTTL